MNDIQIITDRLILRHPIMDDAAEINRAMNEVWPELQKWMSWAYEGFNTIEATQEFVRTWRNWALIGFCRDTGKFVISTGLNPVAGTENEFETGYWVAKEFLGKGYATEATNAVIRYGFEVLYVDAIHTGYYSGNDKSRRVIEKLGFTPLEFKEKSHKRCSDGQLQDEYRLIRKDTKGLPDINVSWVINPVPA